MNKLKAQVHFVFSKEPYQQGFKNWLAGHLEAWVGGLDARNKSTAETLGWGHSFAAVDEEGGLGGFFLAGKYIMHCKMYVYDGTRASATWHNNNRPWFGVVFRDHQTPESNVAKVQALADSFEAYLKSKWINHRRVNYSE